MIEYCIVYETTFCFLFKFMFLRKNGRSAKNLSSFAPASPFLFIDPPQNFNNCSAPTLLALEVMGQKLSSHKWGNLGHPNLGHQNFRRNQSFLHFTKKNNLISTQPKFLKLSQKNNFFVRLNKQISYNLRKKLKLLLDIFYTKRLFL